MIKIFFMYNLIFIFLHNPLVYLGIINSEYYLIIDLIKNVVAGLTLKSSEILLGTFWFIPMMMISKIIYCIILKITKDKIKYNLISMLFFGGIGILLCQKNIFLDYNIQISFISIPFMFLGNFYSKYKKIIDKYICEFGFILSIILIILINRIFDSNVELSIDNIINPGIFFIISVSGIYFCLSLAKIINKYEKIAKKICMLGKKSLHIMALHLLLFKILDFIIYNLSNNNCKNDLVKFPITYPRIGLIYLIIGICGPIVVMHFIDEIDKRWKKYEKRINKHYNSNL